MKKFLLISTIILSASPFYAQRTRIVDSLKVELANASGTKDSVHLLGVLGEIYNVFNPDSCLYYTRAGLTRAQQINDREDEPLLLSVMGLYYRGIGDLPEALRYLIRAQQIASHSGNPQDKSRIRLGMGLVYQEIDLHISVQYLNEALNLLSGIKETTGILKGRILINLGLDYMRLNRVDSAYKTLNSYHQELLPNAMYYSPVTMFLGQAEFQRGNTEQGISLLRQSIMANEKDNDHYTAVNAFQILARMYQQLGRPDSAIYFAGKSMDEAESLNRKAEIVKSAQLLAELYEPRDLTQSHHYLKLASALNEELYGAKKIQGLQQLLMQERERQQAIEQEQEAYRNRQKQYFFFAGLLMLAVIAYILYRNNRQKKRANVILKNTLSDLKATQAQLIQSEKMASLGELTAGIAHEIQNPLNFVNNFSEVNKELIEELKMQNEKFKNEETDQLLEDLTANSERINLHGKRADAIVKSMLEHSRMGKGEKQLTDINALCDEYLRLAYHGLKAKDKDFIADIKTDFDNAIGNINIVPQDIGRVLLNLFNNAFYACAERTQSAGQENLQGFSNYTPVLSVRTQRLGDKVNIIISDNGNGIPDSIKEKIFQPFFTTKPTGSGTGLGLSLSYDIIKAHGGEIKVNSKCHEGTDFEIQLPAV